MEHFDEIRPYHDEEVRPTLNRLVADSSFLNILARHNYPALTENCGPLMEWLTGVIVRRKLRNINDVRGFQSIVEPFLSKVIDKTTSRVSYSGLEHLEKGKPYLFLSNHRDIVLDPAFVNYGLYKNDMETPRLAIGDNLLSRPFVSDLMRLNKSFIVKRSISGRKEKLKTYLTLSAYIHHSIETGHSIWIAQSEGRAKDGNDQTDTAIIKMLNMSKRGKDLSFADSIRTLNIVPVAISYEYDPCDCSKAKELYNTEQHGQYHKADNEDMLSIAAGIEGFKGHVHIAFGAPLTGNYHSATEVATAANNHIHAHYTLHPSNYIAWDLMKSEYDSSRIPAIETLIPSSVLSAKRVEFKQRLHRCPKEHHPLLLKMYAMPVINHYRQKGLLS
ncbi:1-acyl-sn-glycerol-3-phosphate acyltransferase [Endozoicomonas sp. Mp262]|uniref:1-acyl-sn-glycerol-3-phosphate acyltransferase n=1 Tax=Endozoicomonas sp. Mp262 TaxID=2919499 RepID=UPI0021D7E12C